MKNLQQKAAPGQLLAFAGIPWLAIQQAAQALEFAGYVSQGRGIGIPLLSRILWRSEDLASRCEAIRMVTARAAQLN
jgi:hypothetical protein